MKLIFALPEVEEAVVGLLEADDDTLSAETYSVNSTPKVSEAVRETSSWLLVHGPRLFSWSDP